jgi:hypothetical protein
MTDKRLAEMTPDELFRNWERDHSTCHLWTHVRALIQRATREAREGMVPKYRLDATIRELLVMTDYWREAMAQRDEARTQLREAESTIAALREQVAGLKERTETAERIGNEYRKWWKESEAKRHCRCWADRAPDEPCICPAPVEAAPQAAVPSVMGYSLEVNAPDAPDTVTVKHNGKPVFTVALATGGGR